MAALLTESSKGPTHFQLNIAQLVSHTEDPGEVVPRPTREPFTKRWQISLGGDLVAASD